MGKQSKLLKSKVKEAGIVSSLEAQGWSLKRFCKEVNKIRKEGSFSVFETFMESLQIKLKVEQLRSIFFNTTEESYG